MGLKYSRNALMAGASTLLFLATTPAEAQSVAPAELPASTQDAAPAPAEAQAALPADPNSMPGDIVVTAQKRSESINSVPLSIVAATGEQLAKAGITDPGDLVKIVPGFQFTQTMTATPVYTLRGIGFYDNSYSATSTVAVYVDEIALPFVITTTGASLDLERVEVLKGPQGTLFGQNATGGAINYIAAKPTADFHAGFDVSYGRFSDLTGTGFVSGPLTDTLRARAAIRITQGGDWQRSASRPGDTIGSRDEIAGRLLLDWQPLDNVSLLLNLNAWRDRSDLPAAQGIAITPNVPAATPPAVANAILSEPNARSADWTPGYDYERDARFKQASLRAVIDLSPQVTLTSLTSFQEFREDRVQDVDGIAAEVNRFDTHATIRDFSQEARITADLGRFKLIAGGNYNNSRVYEFAFNAFTTSSINGIFTGLGPTAPFLGNFYSVDQYYKTIGGFGNVDFELTDRLTLRGGLRYTKLDGRSYACPYDGFNGTLAQGLSAIFSGIRAGMGLPPVSAGLTTCTSGNGQFQFSPATPELHEDNVAWRAGVDFAIRPGALLYASISRGYKGGSFPTLNATTTAQYDPATQESLQAYEAGFKLSLLDRRVQLNGSAFYYDYQDKQFRGRVLDPIFGSAERQLNIPKSRVVGAEMQLTARAAEGLDLNLGVTYLNTRVLKSNGQDFVAFDSFGVLGPITGESFPYTPKWQLAGGIDYRRPVGSGYQAFLGANARYQSATQTAFNTSLSDPNLARLLSIKDYGVLDLRAGIEDPIAGWRLSVFGRNVTNTYYWTNAVKVLDTTIRYAGRPATYGVSFSFQM